MSSAILFLFACGGAPAPRSAPPSAATEAGAPSSGGEGHGSAGEAAHHEEGAPEAGTHGGPAHGGDMHAHMQHMAEVREMLRQRMGPAYDEPVDLRGADPEAGRSTYQRLCASCHGAEGKGDGPAAAALPVPPSDHTDPMHARYYSDAGRLDIIRNGIPGSPMAGFGATLSEKELLDLYAYVASLRGAGGGMAGHHHEGGDHAGMMKGHHEGGDHAGMMKGHHEGGDHAGGDEHHEDGGHGE